MNCKNQQGLIAGKSWLVVALFGLVALGAGVVAGVVMGPDTKKSQATSVQNSELSPEIPGGIAYPTPRDLKPFTLTDYDGKTFTQSSLSEHWTVVFPGYTFCPDICPVTLTMLNEVKRILDEADAAADVRVVFVSVDPARDTPERLREYTQYFNPDFLGVTADNDALAAFTKQLGMIFVPVKESEDTTDYLVDHSASLALIDPDGDLHALFTPPHNAQKIAEGLSVVKERWANRGAGS